MNLRELVEKAKQCSHTYTVDIEAVVADVLGSYYDLDREAFYARFKSKPIARWYCTNTHVGCYAIFLDERFVGISEQSSRKSAVEYTWLEEEYMNVSTALMSMTQFRQNTGRLFLNLDTDYGDGFVVNYTAQLLSKKLIYRGERVSYKTEREDWSLPVEEWSRVTLVLPDGTEKRVCLRSEVLVPFSCEE